MKNTTEKETIDFIYSLLASQSDARVFEIASFSILKEYYYEETIYWGYSLDTIREDNLQLFKTGRTNANDGGIDFVMKPLGRFFQVTESTDVKKYLLDIDKIERYPITFVIKSYDSVETIMKKIREGAKKQYSVKKIVDKYMNCIEEVINIPSLYDALNDVIQVGGTEKVLEEIIKQSRVEFNFHF